MDPSRHDPVPDSPAHRRFDELQALAEVGWWDWDLDESRPFWSDELCRIFGVPAGSRPTIEEFRAFIHPEDRARLDPELAGREPAAIDFRIRRADGEVRDLLARRDLRRDASGTPTHRLGVIRDVTAQRAAERGRDEAQGLFQTAFSHASVGMALVGLDGRWLQINAAVCRIIGWREEELLARTFQDITHPDDLDADLGLLERLIAGEIPDYQMEKRYVTRTGSHIWALLSVSLVRDESGEPRHLISQIQDISERKRTERQLLDAETAARRERDHAQAIIAAMHEGYALTIDGVLTAVNDAFCEMVGFSREEIVDLKPPYPFWARGRELEIEAQRKRMTVAGGTFEFPLQRRDGTTFDAEVTARAAFGDDGEVIGFVNTVRDVSDRNRLQRELERQARTDSLTGIANRYVLEETLALEVEKRDDHGPLSLLLLDLDHFKQVNDDHGHPVGDAVLAEVAERLTEVVRSGEVLARVGGEEFAWLLPGCDVTGARAAATRARLAIEDRPFRRAGSLTLSVGIGSIRTPGKRDQLYELADTALYEAKQSGRNRVCSRSEVPATALAVADAAFRAATALPSAPARPATGDDGRAVSRR